MGGGNPKAETNRDSLRGLDCRGERARERGLGTKRDERDDTHRELCCVLCFWSPGPCFPPALSHSYSYSHSHCCCFSSRACLWPPVTSPSSLALVHLLCSPAPFHSPLDCLCLPWPPPTMILCFLLRSAMSPLPPPSTALLSFLTSPAICQEKHSTRTQQK